MLKKRRQRAGVFFIYRYTSIQRSESRTMTDFDNTNAPISVDFNQIDWNTFQFPPRPPKRPTTSTVLGDQGLAPDWASPPRAVSTWHLDVERLLIVHPVLRKKIDLSRIVTRQRLIQLCQLVKTQANPTDGFALWNALDEAINNAWGMSLPEMLAVAPERWDWPRDDEFADENN